MFNLCKNCPCATVNKIKDNVGRLSDLEVGQEAEVLSVAGDDELRIKIMEMGVTNSTKIEVVKKAPLKDPISISLRGYELTLRKNEADLVLVNPLN